MSLEIDRLVAAAVAAAERGEQLPQLPNEPRVRDALRRLADERIDLRPLLEIALSIAQDAELGRVLSPAPGDH